MKVEDLKIETLETLHALGSLGALGYEHSLKTDGKKNLNSSLKVSNMTQIQGGISKLKPWNCISLKNTKPLEISENRYQVLFIKMEGQQLEIIILLVQSTSCMILDGQFGVPGAGATVSVVLSMGCFCLNPYVIIF